MFFMMRSYTMKFLNSNYNIDERHNNTLTRKALELMFFYVTIFVLLVTNITAEEE